MQLLVVIWKFPDMIIAEEGVGKVNLEQLGRETHSARILNVDNGNNNQSRFKYLRSIAHDIVLYYCHSMAYRIVINFSRILISVIVY